MCVGVYACLVCVCGCRCVHVRICRTQEHSCDYMTERSHRLPGKYEGASGFLQIGAVGSRPMVSPTFGTLLFCFRSLSFPKNSIGRLAQGPANTANPLTVQLFPGMIMLW